MAFLSVIVPIFKVDAYIRECIESVLTQDFADFEIIAVDDCSPDHGGEIVDEMALSDGRIKPLHLPSNVGLGMARNAGIDAATGEYLLFLDGDDTLSPGSLTAIVNRLQRNDLPELLIYNYSRVWWDGRQAVSWGDEILAALSPHVFAPRDHRRLFNLLPIACNKVYRRDFLNRLGARFGTGYYEDIPFTYSVLLHAESAVTLNRVVLLYRQRRSGGSILATTSPKHFDVFGQYDLVFAQMDEISVGAGLRKHVYDVMINHFVTILQHSDRLAAKDRRAFFDRAAHAARRHLPPAGPDVVNNKASNIRGELFRKRSYRSFALYSWLDRRRRPARRLVGKVYWPLRRTVRKVRHVGRAYYPLARKVLRINPNLVVFSEYWGTGYGCNPRAIFERMREIAPQFEAVWVIEPDKGKDLPPDVRQVRPGSFQRWSVFARGKYFVNNVNFPGTYVKRRGQVHIQTMHGTPLKHCGLDVMRSSVASGAVAPTRTRPMQDGQVVPTDEARNLKEFTGLLKRSDRWDYALSSNAYSTEMWSHAYPCSYTWLEFGYPRNDVLVRASTTDTQDARERVGLRADQTAFLYAPTFREGIGDTSMRIDIAALAEALPQNTVFIVRAHHTATAGNRFKALIAAGRVIDGSAGLSINDCYLAADALITDYSSTMFDYALLERPIIIYADDWDTYRETRGTYFDLMDQPPGAVAMNQRELLDVLRTRSYADERSQALLAAFRAKFCTYDDGDAAANVIRQVMLKS